MRILILTMGTRGDVQPYVALGRALRARGHEVTVSTGSGFDDLIEAHGLRAAPVSTDIREMLQDPAMIKSIQSVSGKYYAWKKYRHAFRAQLDEWWEVARQVRPDVIAFHPKGLPGPHIAEKLGIPAVPAVVIPGLVATVDYPTIVSPLADLTWPGNWLSHKLLLRLSTLMTSGAINAWRRDALGLPPSRFRDPYAFYHPDGRPGPRLHGYSAQLQPKAYDWDEHEHVTGYWHLEQSAGWEPTPELERFLAFGPPPVFVGFGSMPTDDPAALTRLVLDGLAASGRRGILGLAWGGLAKMDTPEDVFVLDDAPYDWLFQRCAAVVHHGGSGTTHEGLRWGRPTVVCPVLLDQPYWGRRVHAIGAGPAPVALRKLTAAGLARSIRETLQPKVVARAAEAGTRMQQEPGATEAARLIEEAVGKSSED